MTLFAELYDSRREKYLRELLTGREGRSTGRLTISNSATNTDEARSVAATWARVLRNGLDKAHAIGK